MDQKNNTSQSFDVLCVGNALIDMFLSIHDASTHCQIVDRDKLCVRLGEKILLDSSSLQVGGNACNVAVGLSRFGHRVALVAEIGEDAFAQMIKAALEHERIATSLLSATTIPSSFAMGLNFQQERVLFVQHMKRPHDFHLTSIQAKAVYLTSLGEEWRTAYERVGEYVRERKIPLYFNPGSHQFAAGREAVLPFIREADVLFVNKEEAGILADDEGRDVQVLLQKLQQLGSKVISITDGKNGSYCLDRNGSMHKIGILDVDVVERTGTGDSYATGFVGALLAGKDVAEAMRWGVINAASVVGKVGAQPGLLTRDEIEIKVAGERGLAVERVNE